MKIRMIVAAGAVFAGIGLLWSCGEDPPRTAETNVPILGQPVSATRPAGMTKPPMLGPVNPSIIVLPAKIAEPQIRVKLSEEVDSPPAVDRSKYAGRVDILRLADNKYIALNTVPLETYVQGVTVKELYGSWLPATYRAQAIAARTFALFQMMSDGRTRAWDVGADTSSQVYGGITRNQTAIDAVAATKGQVLTVTLSGRTGIFCSFYSACIGGASQDPQDAWGDPSIPPLTAHITGAVDNNATRFNWDKDFVITRADLTRCIQNWGTRNNFPYLSALNTIVNVVIAKRNAVTQRPVELTLTDARGKTAPIRAEEFRLALINDPAGKAPKPYSSNCDIRADGSNFVLFNGHGYGHGIGLSQWGAQNLATKGYTHTQILSYFYPGSGLEKLW